MNSRKTFAGAFHRFGKAFVWPFVATVLALCGADDAMASSATGLTGRTLKSLAAGNGCLVGCHAGGGAQGGTVVLAGPASLAAGQTGTYTITNNSTSAVAGNPMGFDIATSDTTEAPPLLAGTATNMRYDAVSGELTHTENGTGLLSFLAQSNASGVGAYTFKYTMPSAAVTSTLHTLYGSSRMGYVSWNETSKSITTAAPFTALLGGSATPAAFTIGQTGTLSTSGGAGGGTVTYATSNSGICSISSTTLTAQGAGTCTITADKAADSTTSALSDTFTLTVNKLNQATLNAFASPSTVTYLSTSTLSTTGGSGMGAVTFASNNTDCFIMGSTLTAQSGTGSCTITATKATDSTYLQTTATVVVTLAKANQATLNAAANPTTVTYLSTSTLSTTGGTGAGVVSYTSNNANCTIMSPTLTAQSGTGSCTITATKAGDTNYLQATATVVVTLAKASQATLNAGASPTTVTYLSTSTLSATGGTGTGAVTFASNNTDCFIMGSTLSAQSGTGSCTITATKAADTNYLQATATVIITLAKASQPTLFAIAMPSTVTYLGLSGLSTSGGNGIGAVTYSSDNANCTISTVPSPTLSAQSGTGSCTITATKAADTNYLQATATVVVTLAQANQAALSVFATPSTVLFQGTSMLSAAGGSGTGLVTYASNSASCAIVGSTLTAQANSGSCTITATKAADANYFSITATVTVTIGSKGVVPLLFFLLD